MLINMSLRSLFWILASTAAASLTTSFAAPLALAQQGVEAILPDGRQIHPAGNWIPVAPFPFAIALKPDGSEAAVPSIGFPFALNVISHPDSAKPTVRRLPDYDARNNDPAVQVHAGLAYAPDGQTLYVATGDSGKIDLYSTADWHLLGEIPLDAPINGEDFTGSFAASVLVSADGRTLYALDQGNWRIAIIDAAARKVIASAPTGADPYLTALSPGGSRLYITNIGLFEYSTIPGAKKDDLVGTGLKFPPYGYPSKEAREGTTVDGKKIPGLGPENSDQGSSLLDLRHPRSGESHQDSRAASRRPNHRGSARQDRRQRAHRYRRRPRRRLCLALASGRYRQSLARRHEASRPGPALPVHRPAL